MLKKLLLKMFPPHSRRGKAARSVGVKLGVARPLEFNKAYQQWIEHVEQSLFIGPIEKKFDKNKLPFISIVVPTYNTKVRYLQPLIYSIVNQSYTKWELILADASTDHALAKYIEEYSAQDPRIKYRKLKTNGGISANTNEGLKFAKGDYIAFMDHDDTISPHSLNEMAAVIMTDPKVEIMYSDEDKLTDDGTLRFSPHFKPDWSPHQYLNCNWTSHFSVIKADLVKKVGGLRPETDGAQDYDFVLRIHALPGTRVVRHIPKVLYHWRVAAGSTAGSVNEKSYAIDAGRRALQDYLDVVKPGCSVTNIIHRPGFYQVEFPKPKHSRKALIIVDASKDKLLNETLTRNLESATTTDIRATFVTAQEFKEHGSKLLDELKGDDHVYYINGIYENAKTSWLDELSSVLELDDVNIVSPRIVDIGDLIYDMGVVKDRTGKASLLFEKLHRHAPTDFGHTEWIRDVMGASGRFFGVRKSDWKTAKETIKELGYSKFDNDKYAVVWSHTEFRFLIELAKSDPMFNPNLKIDEETKIPSV